MFLSQTRAASRRGFARHHPVHPRRGWNRRFDQIPRHRRMGGRQARPVISLGMQGYLSIILHAHLPFVRHPEHEKFLEESWLFEAITETYVPLIQTLEGWRRDGIEAQIT